MPIRDSYSSTAAKLNADGSSSLDGYAYTWNGSVFVKSFATGQAFDAATTQAEIQKVARHVREDLWSPYKPTDPFGPGYMNALQVAYLREAIDEGLVTLQQVLAFAGNYRLTMVMEWGFRAEFLPATLSAEQESILQAGLFSGQLTVGEALTKPSSFLDTSAATPTGSWEVPAGSTEQQAIAQAWSTSAVTAIATEAQKDVAANGGGGVFNAQSAVGFSVVSSPYGDPIQKAYIAFFLRPADPTGFNFYADIMARTGGDLSIMTAGFGTSPEYLQTYAGLSTPQRIDAIYQNLFNRPAEAAGLEYWGSRLDNGTFTINDIAISILVGAQNADALVVGNRVTVARPFTESLDTWSKVDAYSGLAAAQAARAMLKQVTDTPDSVFAATQTRADALKVIGVEGTTVWSSAGDRLTLTNSTKKDVIALNPQSNVGSTDTVIGFAGDLIDLSAFSLASKAVEVKQMAAPLTSSTSAFFGSSSVVIGRVGSDSWLYVDANKDGSFNPASDAVVHVVGTTLLPSDLMV